MNCPGAMLVYKRTGHSYRELPIKMAELGLVHRHELSGALHGLMRVRNFTQDDAHIYMMPDQIEAEVIKVIELADDIYNVFGFSYKVELSTKPEKAIGSDEVWEKATNALRNALEKKGIDYRINPGDGAFYGPKIDFHLEDSIGRTWQCGTIQLDFQMPERFDLNYIGSDGEKHRPVIVHRTILGSIERFFGILVEHFAGKFPVWLSPVQIMIIPVADAHNEFAQDIANQLTALGIRASIDSRGEKLGYRIREAQMQKTPYMLVVGDKEMEGGDLALRVRDSGDVAQISLSDLKEKLLNKIKTKEIGLD
jgi:threonyl-tRNA synthetase